MALPTVFASLLKPLVTMKRNLHWRHDYFNTANQQGTHLNVARQRPYANEGEYAAISAAAEARRTTAKMRKIDTQ